METTLTALRTINSIMDCTKDQFNSILLNYMCRFDDYQQIAADKGKPEETVQYFVDAYNQLDAIFSICFRNNLGRPLSETVRNQSRIIIKYAERLACTELSQQGSAIG